MQGLPLSSQATEHNSQVPTRFSRWCYPSTSVCERWLSQPHHTCHGASNNCRAHLNFRDVTMGQSGCIKTDKVGVLPHQTEEPWGGGGVSIRLASLPLPLLPSASLTLGVHLTSPSAVDLPAMVAPGGSRLTLA